MVQMMNELKFHLNPEPRSSFPYIIISLQYVWVIGVVAEILYIIRFITQVSYFFEEIMNAFYL
jgi:hypothetical protein